MKVNTNKKKTGTFRKDRQKPSTGIGKKIKAGRPPESKDSIRKVVLDLINDYGLSHKSDMLLVDAFCKELELYHICMKKVDSEGVVIEYENGKQHIKQINPAYKAAKIALDNAMKIGKDFGLTTKSRVLMAEHLFSDQEPDDDPLAGMIPGESM